MLLLLNATGADSSFSLIMLKLLKKCWIKINKNSMGMKSNKCLLVIDAQNGIFDLTPPLFKADTVLTNVRQLVENARMKDVPVVFVQHCGNIGSLFEKGTDGWQIHKSLSPAKNDYRIEKKYPDSFRETNLNELLKKLGIGKLVICGVVTEGCIDTTIRRAASLGYKIETPSDAHSTTDSPILKAEQIIAHHNEVFKIFSDVKSTVEISFDK